MSELIVSIFDGPQGGSKVAALNGELDEVSIETLRTKLTPFINDPNIKSIVLDLGQLEFINSKGIGYLVSVHTHLSKDKRELILAAANPAVMDVISLVGLTTIMKYHGSVDEALNGL